MQYRIGVCNLVKIEDDNSTVFQENLQGERISDCQAIGTELRAGFHSEGT
jgi:hypothetical protein